MSCHHRQLSDVSGSNRVRLVGLWRCTHVYYEDLTIILHDICKKKCIEKAQNAIYMLKHYILVHVFPTNFTERLTQIRQGSLVSIFDYVREILSCKQIISDTINVGVFARYRHKLTSTSVLNVIFHIDKMF